MDGGKGNAQVTFNVRLNINKFVGTSISNFAEFGFSARELTKTLFLILEKLQ